MRKRILILLGVLALVVPAFAAAGLVTKGDGTLSVRDGNGRLALTMRGIAFGRVDRGTITIVDWNPDDATVPDFFDTCTRQRGVNDTTTVCQGTDLRFRFAAGRFDVKVAGRGINVTAVGRGTGTIAGSPDTLDDGDYALNGGEFLPLPVLPKQLLLGQPPAGA